MKPGPKLNALVAAEVMDKKIEIHETWGMGVENKTEIIIPPYSTDMSVAWEVVEYFVKKGWGYCLEKSPLMEEHTMWLFPTANPSKDFECPEDMQDKHAASATKAPHAICLAALAAVGRWGTNDKTNS